LSEYISSLSGDLTVYWWHIYRDKVFHKLETVVQNVSSFRLDFVVS